MEQFFQDDVYNLYSDSSENTDDYKIPEMFENKEDNKPNNEGEKNKNREKNLKIRKNSKKITKEKLSRISSLRNSQDVKISWSLAR